MIKIFGIFKAHDSYLYCAVYSVTPALYFSNRNMFGLGQRGIIQTSQAAAISNQLKQRQNASSVSSIMR